MSARDELERLVDRARGVADLQPEVPEQIEHVLDHALAPRRLLVGQQEQQIDVGAGGEQAAPIAAGRDDGHALGVGGVGGAVDVGDRVVVDEADELVLERGEALGAAPAFAVGGELPGRLGARGAQQLLELVEHGRAGLQHGSLLRLEQGHQLAADLAGVEIGGSGGDALVHRARLARGARRSGARVGPPIAGSAERLILRWGAANRRLPLGRPWQQGLAHLRRAGNDAQVGLGGASGSLRPAPNPERADGT